jgi:cell volume regulation protein A
MSLSLNRLRLPYDGMYPVFALAYAMLAYSTTAAIGGSGFLAVYVVGIVAGTRSFIHQKSLVRFFDGIAWLSQVCMFLAMGLLVTPSDAIDEIMPGLVISACLMFLARPLSVLISMGPSSFPWRERLFVAWVGLRGAVPIVLATFPWIAGVAGAERLFNVVFFVVLTSALLQGWSIPLSHAAQGRRTDGAPTQHPEMIASDGVNTDLVTCSSQRFLGGRRPLVELGFPGHARGADREERPIPGPDRRYCPRRGRHPPRSRRAGTASCAARNP